MPRSRRLFLSYRHDDTALAASLLHRQLEQRYGGRTVFLDRADIGHGGQWRAAIQESISAADTVIVLIGPQWIDILAERMGGDDLVRYELSAALSLNKAIVPVLLGGASAPKAGELPPDIRAIADIQALQIDENALEDGDGLRALLGVLKPSWWLGAAWALGTVLGFVIGVVVVSFTIVALFSGSPRLYDELPVPSMAWVVLGAAFGGAVVFPQWLILHRWFTGMRGQILGYIASAMIIAWLVGSLASAQFKREPSDPIGAYLLVIVGLIIMASLWCVFTWLTVRRQLIAAGWWASLNMLNPLVGLLVAFAIGPDAATAADAAFIIVLLMALPLLGAQLISGYGLVWLMRSSDLSRQRGRDNRAARMRRKLWSGRT